MYRDALAQATIDDDIGIIAVGRMTRSQKQQKKQEKMRALAIAHPELLAALNERQVLDKKFRQARDEKYGK